MSSRSTIRYTYEDYLTIPEDSSGRHEIVYGELFVTPAPRFRHQQVVGRLLRILMDRLHEHELGEAELRDSARGRFRDLNSQGSRPV